MERWLTWTVPVVAVATAAVPTTLAHASQYLGVEEAQRLAFPEARRFAEAHVVYKPADIAAIEAMSHQKIRARGQQVWRAEDGDRLLGYFIVDYVIGKHLVIDYALALGPDGRVRQVDILTYRESYGGEIRNPDWLRQFVGKDATAPLELNRDIVNISGATLSSRHVTEGVKRLMAFHQICLRQNVCGS